MTYQSLDFFMILLLFERRDAKRSALAIESDIGVGEQQQAPADKRKEEPIIVRRIEEIDDGVLGQHVARLPAVCPARGWRSRNRVLR